MNKTKLRNCIEMSDMITKWLYQAFI